VADVSRHCEVVSDFVICQLFDRRRVVRRVTDSGPPARWPLERILVEVDAVAHTANEYVCRL
jgi:hypothetical protein